MLWTIAVVLLVLWALGMVTSYTLGGLIHVLLVLAAIAVLFRLCLRTKGSLVTSSRERGPVRAEFLPDRLSSGERS